MTVPSLHIVAIAGGSGTRFWPLSRAAAPKQLLKLGGERSLLAATFARSGDLAPTERHWMVVGAAHGDACAAAVPAIDRSRVLVEPAGRNTAPAIALAAIHLLRESSEALMAVMPADHHVADSTAFAAAVRTAAGAARKGAIATLGVTPEYAETGYGYIERGEADPRGGYRVTEFHEKPDPARAAAFVERGTFAWNAGIFVMGAAVYMAELERQLPDLHAAFAHLAAAIGSAGYAAELAATYERIGAISIDYGVMENARDVVVVPFDCGWSDVGSLRSLGALGRADASGNVTAGRVIALDTARSIVHAHGDHAVVLLGVSDLVVVHTEDATLVMPTERAQDVRDVVAAVRERGWGELL